MKKLIVALAVLPMLAFAQGAAPGAGTAPGGRPGMGPGAGPGPGRGMGPGAAQPDPERMEKRMRLARTLGLAEALDLEPAQALKLGEAIAKFDERRLAAHKQHREARDVLRRAARGDKLPPAEVDQAIQKGLEAGTQLQAIDREVLATVTKDLAPEKKARAVLFLDRFQGRFGPGMRGGMKDGHHRGGMGPGKGMGPGGMGMGAGSMGMAPGTCPSCPWDDDEE
jgi:hypothetical protein